MQQPSQTDFRTHETAIAGAWEPNQLTYVPAGTGKAYWGPGDHIRFLITGEQTGGAFFMAEVSVPPGGGTRPHVHRREDECFHLLQGTLAVEVGGTTVNAWPGDLVYLPRGIAHSFRNISNLDAKFLVVVTPAGLEKFFEEAFYPATDASAERPLVTEAWLARVLAAASRHGLELAVPHGSLANEGD
jgi:quercetin dioxygenase-like cupin family protein